MSVGDKYRYTEVNALYRSDSNSLNSWYYFWMLPPADWTVKQDNFVSKK